MLNTFCDEKCFPDKKRLLIFGDHTFCDVKYLVFILPLFSNVFLLAHLGACFGFVTLRLRATLAHVMLMHRMVMVV